MLNYLPFSRGLNPDQRGIFITLLFLAFFSFPALVQAQETPFVDGDLIVMLVKGEEPQKVLAKFSEVNGFPTGITHRQELSGLSNIHLFHIDFTSVDQQMVLERIQNQSWVLAAQFNHYVDDRATPNDPSFGTQWHHVDASDNDIDSDLAWDITTGGTTANGDNIVVCVIEGGGADWDHSDLLANHWTNSGEIPNNGIDDDSNGYVDDFDGWNTVGGNDNIPSGNHGTAVSGMIGATGNNSNGGAGVNWNVDIMQCTVGSLTESNVIAAYNYPYVMRDLYNSTGGSSGAFVVATNASWGIDNANPALYPVWCAYYDDLGSVGILNCGATTNNNVNIDVNGDMPTGCSSVYMVSCTATNSSDVRTFSGYGVVGVDLGAPGENVYLPTAGSGYGFTSGTSFASPCTAGAIALMYSAPCSDIASLALTNPQAAADQMRAHLFNGVDPVAGLATEVATGGRLNVRNSIDLLLASCAAAVPGCTDPGACNYDPAATTNDGSCVYGIFSWYLPIDFSNFPEPAVWACSAPAGYYLANNQACVQTVVNADPYCQNTDWDSICNNAYCACGGSGCINPAAINYNASAACDDGSCYVIGCTDAVACNYNASANVDNGCCCYDNCVTLNMTDSFGDGWNGATYTILDDDNSVIESGTLSSGSSGSATFCFEDGCYSIDVGGGTFDTEIGWTLSGVNGGDISGGAPSVDIYFSTGAGSCNTGCMDVTACNYTVSANVPGFCTYPGCTWPAACNYSSSAGCDDGSCCYENCLSIDMTDGFGDGWNNAYYTITSVIGIVVQSGTLTDGSFGSEEVCLSDGCYSISVGGGFFDSEISWNLLGANGGTISGGAPIAGVQFSVGSSACYAGCTDSSACNFDPLAASDDGSCAYELWYLPSNVSASFTPMVLACNCPPGYYLADQVCAQERADFDSYCYSTDWDTLCQSEYNLCLGASGTGCLDQLACNYDPTSSWSLGYNCEFPGCTYPSADNYDSLAGCDDESCVFSVSGCVTDLNGDDQTNTADLLILLASFGSPC